MQGENSERDEDVLGINCPIYTGCTGAIYPADIQAIPTSELFLEDGSPIDAAELEKLGNEFKNWYNTQFIRNRIIQDYDEYKKLVSSMKGGQQPNVTLLDFVYTGTAEESCPLPRRNMNAGKRIKTYRKRLLHHLKTYRKYAL